MKRQFTAVSLFCGAGGLDIGFERAGFKTIWANDFNKDACETHRRWSEADVVCGDVTKIDPETIPDCDVILGGFPCQGFSFGGARRMDDPRNALYKQYVRIVEHHKPAVFVGENVTGLLTMGGGSVMKDICEAFSACGYRVFAQSVNAKDYDVPQDRKRIIIAGFREDLGFDQPFFIQQSENKVTIGDVLQHVRNDAAEAYRGTFTPRYMSRNRKRDWNEVSFTIPASARHVPLYPGSPDMVKIDRDKWEFGDGETRRLSWREAAAIQTFPEDMEFCGDMVSKYRQIGNAVPCNLAYHVGKYIHGVLCEKMNTRSAG